MHSKTSNLRYLTSNNYEKVCSLLETFSKPNCNLLHAQRLITDIGKLMGQEIKNSVKHIDILCPILRAGFPLAVGLSYYFQDVPLLPIKARRCSGKIKIQTLESVPDQSVIMLIDTIGATGLTVVSIANKLVAEKKNVSIIVIISYVSPEAILAMSKCSSIVEIWIGKMADKVDQNGYLVPYTNGDAGDKLYSDLFNENI